MLPETGVTLAFQSRVFAALKYDDSDPRLMKSVRQNHANRAAADNPHSRCRLGWLPRTVHEPFTTSMYSVGLRRAPHHRDPALLRLGRLDVLRRVLGELVSIIDKPCITLEAGVITHHSEARLL
jgi:hypothetical protein